MNNQTFTCVSCEKDYFSGGKKNMSICFMCTCNNIEEAALDYYLDSMFSIYFSVNGNLELFRVLSKNVVRPSYDSNEIRKIHFN
jgi:hypothetical protein